MCLSFDTAPCTKKCSSGVAENIYYKAFGNVFVF